MLNRDVFQTDPDAYRIANQGVAKISFPPSLDALATLRGELETFVCDGRYAEGLARILEAFLAAAGRGAAPAVWISGFYGSGKSHLASMLAALWTDVRFPDGATARGLVPNLPPEVAAPLTELRAAERRAGGSALAAGDTLGSGSPDPVESALAILLQATGLPAEVRSARVALWLASEGVLDAVRRRLGEGFDRHVRNFVLSTDFAEAVLAAKPGLARGPDELGDKLAAQFPAGGPGAVLDAGEMVRIARQALTLGRDEVPLTLLVLDEVQQFLNQRPEATLRVQALAERLAGEFDGRVLLVCTGQQALADLPNLQKLLGRFPVQVALGEADIDAVIRKTVLRKKPSAEGEVRAMLDRHAGEVSRHLRGSRIAHTARDDADAVLDWPLLPSRRRVWELILRELDRTGLGGTLRGQLRTTLDAARRQAPKPLGHAVPADFLYGRFADEAFNAGLLPAEARDRIERLRAGRGADDPLKARILMLVYMLGRVQADAGRHGVRPVAEVLADLLVEDLAGEPDLRRRVPGLLEELREDGAVIEVEGEWRLQTKESADWELAYRQAFKDKQADEAGLAAARSAVLRAALAAALPGTARINQGRSNEPRDIHHLSPGDKAPADGVPLRRHDGWEADLAQLEREIAAAPATDPTVHLLVPSHRTGELRKALVEAAAARSVIDRQGVPQTPGGEEARRAMESREAVAARLAGEIAEEAVAAARVVQAGGSVVGGPLAQAVRTAAANALARRYPAFGDGDHPGWGKALEQARKRLPDAIKAVDHHGVPEAHPVCKAVLGFLGAGRKGKEIREHFTAPPYGWPQDAVDAALTILDNAGQLRVAGEDGKATALADLPRAKIGLCSFRSETEVVTALDRIAVRGLLAAAGVQAEKDQEVLKLSALLERMQAAARDAGGDAPAPAPAALPDGPALLALSGNALLKALAERAKDLRAALESWRATRASIDQRLPAWRLAERLVALGAGRQAAELDAVRAARSLLAEPDPVPPIVQAAADDLRVSLNAAVQAWQAAWDEAEARLRADPFWNRLSAEQRRATREAHGLLPADAPRVATPGDVVAALERRTLAGWADLAKALPTRVDEALAEAALLLEPKARLFPLPGGTLRDEAELDAWLSDLRARLAAALADGPVILKA